MTQNISARFWAKVRVASPKECWEWTAYRRPKGYGQFAIDARRKAVPAHRVAYELTNGPIGDGLSICHRCDNPACCNPSHLFAASNAVNVADKVRKNRHAKGEMIKRKLSEPKVRAIRDEYAAGGITVRKLAALYDIDHSTVVGIINRTLWKHVA